MVEIRFLGGAREVGRSAVQLNAGSDSFLFDYGLEVQHGDVPMKPRLPLSGVFISHAHIDHSGMAPQLYRMGYGGSVYTTRATAPIMEILLKDSIKVQKKRGEQPHFLPSDIQKAMHLGKMPGYGEPVRFKSSAVTLLDAGHIPGAAGILLESQGKRVLYTGDIKFIETRLVRGARMDVKGLDALICESTYSYKDHPDRAALEDRLRELAQETVYNNGFLILPSFAVGRTQELLMVLHDLGFPIHVDGMGIEVAEAMLQHPESVRDSRLLQRAFSRAHKVMNFRDRNKVLEKPGIIICTAGMLNGGPVSYYIKKLHDRENCTLALTGFMVEGTVGRRLLDTGRYVNEGLDVKPRMKMEFMDFSAHTSRTPLIDFFRRTKPRKVFLVHGDRTQEFSRELQGMGIDAHAPKNGESVKV
jgi:putative mRNA 3-end processing factor